MKSTLYILIFFYSISICGAILFFFGTSSLITCIDQAIINTTLCAACYVVIAEYAKI